MSYTLRILKKDDMLDLFYANTQTKTWQEFYEKTHSGPQAEVYGAFHPLRRLKRTKCQNIDAKLAYLEGVAFKSEFPSAGFEKKETQLAYGDALLGRTA